jgi:imidazolonepropionase
VVWVGPAADAPAADQRRDLGGRAAVPGFVDSHSHLVFDGDRGPEFAARMAGAALRRRRHRTTVAATRGADDDRLRALLGGRVAEMRRQGTTTVEVKSGYGLTVDDEVRALRLAREVTAETTFLGAHVVPAGADRSGYLDLVTGPMLAACAPHARWVDVFCEPGSRHAFDGDEARAVLEAGRRAGLGLRVHGNQLGPGPGVRPGGGAGRGQRGPLHAPGRRRRGGAGRWRHGSHAAAGGGVQHPVALPGRPRAARRRGGRGAGHRLQPRHLLLLVDAADDRAGGAGDGDGAGEALWASTAGGAAALRRDDVGVVRVGGAADLAVLDAPSHLHLAYRPGVPIARALDL